MVGLIRTCPWPSGKGAGLPSRRTTLPGGARFDSRRALFNTEFSQTTLGDRLTAGCLPLKQVMKVRILLPELANGELEQEKVESREETKTNPRIRTVRFAVWPAAVSFHSLLSRLFGREPPRKASRLLGDSAGQLLLVVTPDSESGGRWFDSSSRNSPKANRAGERRKERVDKTEVQRCRSSCLPRGLLRSPLYFLLSPLLRKSSCRMRGLSRKQVSALGGLWVQVPRLPLNLNEFVKLKSRGPAATTPGLHPGNDGSSPSGIIDT